MSECVSDFKTSILLGRGVSKAKALKGNYEYTSKLKIPEGWGD